MVPHFVLDTVESRPKPGRDPVENRFGLDRDRFQVRIRPETNRIVTTNGRAIGGRDLVGFQSNRCLNPTAVAPDSDASPTAAGFRPLFGRNMAESWLPVAAPIAAAIFPYSDRIPI